MSNKVNSRGRGRPPEHDEAMAVTIPLRLPAHMIEAVDEMVANRFDAPSRNAVLRELIAEAIMARRAREPA